MSVPFRPLFMALSSLLFAISCGPRDSRRSVGTEEPALFVNVTEKSGVRFRHENGASGKFRFIESTPGGVALFDFNNDGWLDLFLVQSGSSDPPQSVKNRPRCALYRNDGDGSFTDATSASGFDMDLGYAQGVATADYDNDGFEDLFLTSFGRNRLFRNEGGTGKFKDVTMAMGLDKLHSTGYSTSAAFGDIDNDGRLDLYVCYYCPWSWTTDKPCRDSAGIQDYCSPDVYDLDLHRLYRNTGSKFEDISLKSGSHPLPLKSFVEKIRTTRRAESAAPPIPRLPNLRGIPAALNVFAYLVRSADQIEHSV